MNRRDLVARLRYPNVWLEHGLLTAEVCAAQAAELEAEGGHTDAPEHYRYGAFLYWIRQDVSESVLLRLLSAAAADPDPPMAGAALRDIVSHPASTSRVVDFAADIASRSPEYYCDAELLRQTFEEKSAPPRDLSITPDEIERVAADVNALHRRIHETHAKGPDGREEWTRACKAFHAYNHPLFNLWKREVLRDVVEGIGPWRNVALLFLEVDPWFFRSGYLKAKVAHAIKQAVLGPRELERVENILVAAVDSRHGREFREYCRLAARHGSSALRDKLSDRAKSTDDGVRARARWMLSYIERHANPIPDEAS